MLSSSLPKHAKLKSTKDHAHHQSRVRRCLDKHLLTKRFPVRGFRRRVRRSGRNIGRNRLYAPVLLLYPLVLVDVVGYDMQLYSISHTTWDLVSIKLVLITPPIR